ncbi:imidazole glycerol phosphate synthase subunit HisF [Candidatus Micrarchaeota archaeon]|nr:imidazole glycerol phosphate synthase subunit HisF [Candidatus Micrarchaeota archaeon]
MLLTRVMPCLLLKNDRLVKTIQFKDANYVGDPVNAIKIYNEKQVDELVVLDISATRENRKPAFEAIQQIADECFMPLTYGGGITSLDDARRLFALGVEKIVVNTHAVENPSFITQASEVFGAQAVMVSIDAKKTGSGYEVFTRSGTTPTGLDPAAHALNVQKRGAGEIFLTSIDREGTLQGYDLELIRQVSRAVSIPVIACGGAWELMHFKQAVDAGASAVAAGSMAVYMGRNRAVLINFPNAHELSVVLNEKR